MAAPVKAIFDCNVLLQAAAYPFGPAGRCVQLAAEQVLTMVTSKYALAEFAAAAGDWYVQTSLGLTPRRVETFLARTGSFYLLHDPVPSVFRGCRDPKDDHYIDLARVAGAPLVISRDKDLLSLRLPDLRVVPPNAVLREFEPPWP